MSVHTSIPAELKVAGFTLAFRYRGQLPTCYVCQEVGHTAKECPKSRKALHKQPVRKQTGAQSAHSNINKPSQQRDVPPSTSQESPASSKPPADLREKLNKARASEEARKVQPPSTPVLKEVQVAFEKSPRDLRDKLENAKVTILIGSDVPEAHWIFEQRRGRPKEPLAARTLLGWTLLDPVGSVSRQESPRFSQVRKKLFDWCKCKYLRKLDPILVDGIIRVGGRIDKAPVCYNVRHPMILPGKHHATALIIKHYHHMEGHVGISQVLATIRQKFWVLQGPAAVKQVVGECLTCQRWNSRPESQIMAPLPDARVTPAQPPFSCVGIDYFGLIPVKVKRSTVKRYGCVFTCLGMRAVHIEIAYDLSTDSFIQAFMRFVSRRGPPHSSF
ncbi:Gypsy retrotransposon integrase 1 [Paramuricea clavata]|uniref:Gypsy retrotransposon integrase 1 n=1 Tax=Paramuricea clavata TaxID=317549 RepID=A0A6S7JFE4_PARCT|nr:Gypsy retrotransposon integrase 1 [Paramuricea clavata]